MRIHEFLMKNTTLTKLNLSGMTKQRCGLRGRQGVKLLHVDYDNNIQATRLKILEQVG